MREPSPRTSRLAIAGGLAAAFILVGAGYFAGRSTVREPEAPVPVAAATQPPPAAPDPAILNALGRPGLLAMAAQAADAFASNVPMPATIHAAAGRRFDLVLPFGCEAADAVESPGAMRWTLDPKAATLRVTVDPVIWQSDEWPGDAATDGEAALRGFWIARPWSTATSCAALRKPTANAAEAPPTPPSPTVAIARLIGAADAGKSRPYEIVMRAAAVDFDPQQGLRLRVVGRIQSGSAGSPVHCVQPAGGEHAPLCVITASFAEVRIENPKSGAVLASWPIADEMRGDEVAGDTAGSL